MNTYDKIEEVMKKAKLMDSIQALAPHEFADISMPVRMDQGCYMNGRSFVGCSESTLGRRLREMAQDGRLTRKTREGKTFVEYALAVKPVAAAPELAGQHSGGL